MGILGHTLVVNGERHRVTADPDRALLFVLREDLDLTGAKYGCGEGQCGACTVLVDGTPTRSCVTPLSAVAGKAITTIEGIADGDRLHPLQRAFIECDAMQCGYCTAGMIVSGVALLHRNHAPTELEIKQALQGNICRCGTYSRIVSAVRMATQLEAREARGAAHA
jgi:aerobic-type carbon monoxide dehydrogenase small subunit (CoxS/CutS family)